MANAAIFSVKPAQKKGIGMRTNNPVKHRIEWDKSEKRQQNMKNDKPFRYRKSVECTKKYVMHFRRDELKAH